MKKTLCVLLAVVMVFTLFACATPTTTDTSPSDPGTTDTDTSPSDPSTSDASPSSGGTMTAPESLTVGVSGGLGRFLSGLNPTESITGCDAVFDTVFRWDPIDKEVISNILSSWEWEDDNTFVMHMRDDVYFSNGENATAEDLVFSYLSHIERGSNYVNDAKLVVDECIARDTYTAQFKLEDPYSAFPYLRIYFLDKSWSQGLADGWDSEEWYRPVGSGPYSVEEWVNDSYMVLKSRGEDYWYKDEGPIVIDEMTIKSYPDQSTLYMALETGEVDLAGTVGSNDYATFMDNGGDGFDVTTTKTGSIDYFCFGFKTTDKFEDVRVREAIALGVKWDEVGVAAYGPFYSEAKSVASVINPDYIEVGTYEYNPERAMELLAEAGYGPDNPLTISTVSMQGPFYEDSFQIFEFYASQLGIVATCEFVDVSTAIGAWISPTGCDFNFWSMYGGCPGGLLTYSLGWVDNEMGVFFTHMTDPEFLRLYTQIKTATEDSVRSEATRELQQYAYDGFWRIPVSEETVAFGWRTDILTKDQVDRISITANHQLISRLALESFW